THILRFRPEPLEREAPDRGGNADRAGDAAGKIMDRHGDAARLGIELAIIEANAVAPYRSELALQCLGIADRLGGEAAQLMRRKKALELIGGEVGEQHLAERRAMRRSHDADG